MLVEKRVRYPVQSRIRAYGKARIDIARRAKSSQDWETLWKKPQNDFPFKWGSYWKQCVEYRVDDFATEVGFYIDVLGLPVNAFDPDYAMFTSPQGDFYFSILQVPEGGYATPPDAFRLQFMVEDIFATTAELERRGIAFEQPPQAVSEGSTMYIGYFRTPHGICIDLWGIVTQSDEGVEQADLDEPILLAKESSIDDEQEEGDEEDDFDADELELEDDPFEDLQDEPETLTQSGHLQTSDRSNESRASLEPEYVEVEEEEDEEIPAYKPIPLRR